MRLAPFIVMMIVTVIVLVMIVTVIVLVMVVVIVLVEMLVGIMKMHVAFSNQLPNQIIKTEKQERPARYPRKPGADGFAEGCTK